MDSTYPALERPYAVIVIASADLEGSSVQPQSFSPGAVVRADESRPEGPPRAGKRGAGKSNLMALAPLVASTFAL